MNVKKEVIENLKSYFKVKLSDIDLEIWRNKYEINRLVEKQQVLKRSRSKLDQLGRALENN